jgi:hypothetical protein
MFPPKCPHCSENLPIIDAVQRPIGNTLSGPMFQAVVASCPHCKKLLGMLSPAASDDRLDKIDKAIERLRSILKKFTGYPS